ncbi:hypothetical protein DFH29DRAFT_1081170 [Suillus ampliporus]|nr:hypothetical protein DFH29DRAFT_1081170 [Suillus ampliporus]
MARDSERSDKENSNKRLRSQSPETGIETPEASDVKRPKQELIRHIPLEEIAKGLQISSNPAHSGGFAAVDIPQTPIPPYISPKTPAPPYRQTPAPIMVSQNYIRGLVKQRWDAEVRCCEEARKAQLLEVQLAAHGITKLV